MRSLLLFSSMYAGISGLQKGLGFIIYIWMAYILSVEDYALFGMLLSLQSGIAALATAGLADSLIGFVYRVKSQKRIEFWYSVANGIFIYLAMASTLLAILVLLLPVWGGELSPLLKAVVIAGGILSAFCTFQAALLRLDEKHVESMMFLNLGPMFGMILAATLVFIFKDVSSYFVGISIGLVVTCFVLYRVLVGHFRFYVRPKTVEPMRKAIGPYLLIAFLAWASGYGIIFMVKILASDLEVSRFTFAYTLSSTMHLIATSTNQVWGPRFLRLIKDFGIIETEKENASFYFMQGVAIGLFGFLVMSIFPFASSIIGGNFYLYKDLSLEIFVLFVAYAVSIPWWHAQNYYLVYNCGPKFRDLIVVSAISGLLLNVICIYIFGSIGIYIGFLIHALIRSAFVFQWAHAKWGLRILWQGPLTAILLLYAGLLLGVRLT